MLSNSKKARTDASAIAWAKAQPIIERCMPDMFTLNNGEPFDPRTMLMTSVEFCFYSEGDALETSGEIAQVLGKSFFEINQKLLPDDGGCDYFQLTLQDAVRFFGQSFCSVLLRLYRAMNDTAAAYHNAQQFAALIQEIVALDETACNLIARLQNTETGAHPLTFLARHNNDCAFYFIDKLASDTCDNLAMQDTTRGYYFHRLHMEIPNEETRQALLSKISDSVLLLIANDSETIRMFMSISIQELTAILQSLGTEIAKIFMLSKTRTSKFFSFEDRNGFAGECCLAEALYFSHNHNKMSERNLRYLNECLNGNFPARYLKTLGLKEIEFARMGNAIDNWWRLASMVMSLVKIPQQRVTILDTLPAQLSTATIKHTANIAAIAGDAKMEKVLGRTLLFRKASQAIHAVKVKKREEDVNNLKQELCVTTTMLSLPAKHRLKSRFPTPRGMVVLQDLIPWAEKSIDPQSQFLSRIDAATLHPAYVYEVKSQDAGYFIYLHDVRLSDVEFTHANHVIVHDLFKLLQLGQVFNQLADLFHDSAGIDKRTDRGRHIVLAQLLNQTRNNYGTGMLESWMEAIEFPNLRATGLADLGDCISINDYIQMLPRVQQSYAKAFEKYGRRTGNYLIANIMAEYQYVLFLIAGRRAVQLEQLAAASGASEDDQYQIWYNIARQIIKNCAQAIAMNTFLSEQEALLRLNKIVNVNRLAVQMQFWMTKRYIPFLLNGTIPSMIYGDDVNVTIDINQFKKGNLDSVLGFTSNGKTSDLGDYNGQEPIKEANKLFYWMVNLIFVEYVNINKMLNDVSVITRAARNPLDVVGNVYVSQHLGAAAKHALLFSMWRLQRNAKKQEQQEQFENDHPEFKRTKAAVTIQRIWRGRNKRVKFKAADIHTSEVLTSSL